MWGVLGVWDESFLVEVISRPVGDRMIYVRGGRLGYDIFKRVLGFGGVKDEGSKAGGGRSLSERGEDVWRKKSGVERRGHMQDGVLGREGFGGRARGDVWGGVK